MGKITKNFIISCKGLKPNTIHKFFYEGVDNTTLCKSYMQAEINSNVLKTDSYGGINFSFELAVDQSQTLLPGRYSMGSFYHFELDISGTKKFELKATDSNATSTVKFNDYTALGTI